MNKYNKYDTILVVLDLNEISVQGIWLFTY